MCGSVPICQRAPTSGRVAGGYAHARGWYQPPGATWCRLLPPTAAAHPLGYQHPRSESLDCLEQVPPAWCSLPIEEDMLVFSSPDARFAQDLDCVLQFMGNRRHKFASGGLASTDENAQETVRSGNADPQLETRANAASA